MLINHCANLNHWLDQSLWCKDVTQAQRWIENFTHCAGIDNPAGVIKPLQAWERGTGVPKFRVVIILENVSVAGAGKIDQCRPPRQAHGHTKWELMRRSNIDDFRRPLSGRPRDGDPFPVNRLWNNARACKAKSSASLVKSRIFHPCNLSAIYQGHRADHHRLLRSSGNDDLVRVTTRASVITQISRQRFAQVRFTTA